MALAEESLRLQETALAYVVLSKRHLRPRAYGSIGMGRDFDGAIALLEKALSIEPGNADVMAELAFILVFAGQVERAAALMEEAKRLNPSYPIWYHRPSGTIRYFRGEYELASADFRAWREAEPLESSDAGLWLAAAQAMAGKTVAADEALLDFRKSFPFYTALAMSNVYSSPIGG